MEYFLNKKDEILGRLFLTDICYLIKILLEDSCSRYLEVKKNICIITLRSQVL